jgi:hypothetical protein
MNIGVLIICTGKYNIFFHDLYESCENFFLKNHKKTYYVFTDNDIPNHDNVVKIHSEFIGWPQETMYRFHKFISIKEMLNSVDYLYFMNANMLVISEIGDEILPNHENDFLMGVQHPGFYNTNKISFPYERRKESKFFINYDDGLYYYQGCFLGGRTKEFLIMSENLMKNIDEDINNNITPIWHDESAQNWYYKNLKPLMLHSGYSYPESWNIPFEKKIVQRDKNNYGGYNYLRNI